MHIRFDVVFSCCLVDVRVLESNLIQQVEEILTLYPDRDQERDSYIDHDRLVSQFCQRIMESVPEWSDQESLSSNGRPWSRSGSRLAAPSDIRARTFPVCGFPGCGKTAFLRRLIHEFEHSKVHVVRRDSVVCSPGQSRFSPLSPACESESEMSETFQNGLVIAFCSCTDLAASQHPVEKCFLRLLPHIDPFIVSNVDICFSRPNAVQKCRTQFFQAIDRLVTQFHVRQIILLFDDVDAIPSKQLTRLMPTSDELSLSAFQRLSYVVCCFPIFPALPLPPFFLSSFSPIASRSILSLP